MNLYIHIIGLLEKLGAPIILLIMRLWMASIFWYSGLSKISNWDNALYLFEHEHKVPFLPIELAAIIATTFELICPVLLTIGLASRLASLPMLAMTAVIQFTYLDLIDHSYWGMLLATILFYGPGRISLDYLIRCKYASLWLPFLK